MDAVIVVVLCMLDLPCYRPARLVLGLGLVSPTAERTCAGPS
jgi:hypothetical protein